MSSKIAPQMAKFTNINPIQSSLFLGRFWTKIQSDNCFETVSTPGLLLEGWHCCSSNFVYNFSKTPWFPLMWMVRFVTFVHKDLWHGTNPCQMYIYTHIYIWPRYFVNCYVSQLNCSKHTRLLPRIFLWNICIKTEECCSAIFKDILSIATDHRTHRDKLPAQRALERNPDVGQWLGMDRGLCSLTGWGLTCLVRHGDFHRGS